MGRVGFWVGFRVDRVGFRVGFWVGGAIIVHPSPLKSPRKELYHVWDANKTVRDGLQVPPPKEFEPMLLTEAGILKNPLSL